MKNLLVYWSDGRWFGSEISWKRSGSGSYRETALIEIPQTPADIEKFAAENQYSIEWRKPLPESANQPGTPAG
jgi:hypothetical protein